MPQLDVHTYSSQIFWLVISFLLLFVVVRSLAHPRLKAVVSERAARTGGDLEAAEAARAAAAERDAALAERLAKAHDAARAEIARATEESRERTSASLKDLGVRLAARAAEAEASLVARRAAAETELSATARDLTGELVRRLTSASPGAERIDAALAAARA